MSIKQAAMFGCAAALLAMAVWPAVPAGAKIGIAQSQMPTLWVDAASPQTREDGTPNAPFKTLAKALANAKQNSLVHVKSGEYRENVVLTNGVMVKGEGNSSTGEGLPVLRAADPKKPVMTIRGQAGLEFSALPGVGRGFWSTSTRMRASSIVKLWIMPTTASALKKRGRMTHLPLSTSRVVSSAATLMALIWKEPKV